MSFEQVYATHLRQMSQIQIINEIAHLRRMQEEIEQQLQINAHQEALARERLAQLSNPLTRDEENMLVGKDLMDEIMYSHGDFNRPLGYHRLRKPVVRKLQLDGY